MRGRALLMVALLAVGVNATPAPADPGGGPLFSRQALPPTVRPVQSVLADLNGDGRADLVSAVGRLEAGFVATQGISVMLARPSGGFAPAALYPAALVVSSFDVTDVNGDGLLDVVAALGSQDGGPSRYLGVYTGAPDGTLAGPDVQPSSTPFRRLAVGRFADDTVHAVRAADNGLLLSRAVGSRFVDVGVLASGAFLHVEAVDFGGDGQPEVVAASSNGTLTVFDGFAAGPSVALGGVRDLQAVDADGDGHEEVVVTTASGQVVLYSGVLQELRRLTSSAQASAATAGDWDGDGQVDLVRANGTASLTVLSSRRGGTVVVPLAAAAVDVLLAEATNDGHLDLLAVERDAAVIEVIEGDGLGGFPPKRTVASDAGAGYDRAFTDLDNDGAKDFLGTGCWTFIGDPPSREVKSLLADGKGGFTFKASYTLTGMLCGMSAGDFNGDGNVDVALGDYYTGGVRQALGNGDGTFGPVETHLPGCWFGVGTASADFNGDGYDDVALLCRNVPTSALAILAGSPAGLVSTPVILPYQFGAETWEIITGDLNGDDRPDLIVASFNNNPCTFAMPGVHTVCQSQDPDTLAEPINYFLSLGNLLFERSHSFVQGSDIYGVAAADVNGDGRDEIVTVHPSEDAVRIRYVRPDGGPGASVKVDMYEYPWALALADVNADGHIDLVTTHGPMMVSVTPGTGDGGFGHPTGYVAQAATGRPFIDDVDGDGDTDVLVTEVGGIEAFRNGE